MNIPRIRTHDYEDQNKFPRRVDTAGHLRASWIFTRADVIANLGVIAAGVLVMAAGSRWPDLVIGTGIGLYVLREAAEIVREARSDAPAH